MDEIKEAFSRVREDINFLFDELNLLKEEIKRSNLSLYEFKENILNLNSNITMLKNSLLLQQTDRQTNKQTKNFLTPSQLSQNPSTDKVANQTNPPHIFTQNPYFNGLNPQILGLSTGNEGVPTDRQTNQQTDQQTQNSSHNIKKPLKNSFENALEVLDSLDSLKKELRIKFKRLTDQEMTVFSLLYQLSEEQGYCDYKILSNKLNLSESSIRDYVGRLLNKGIPVDKTKINNKQIQLSVSKNLKKVASLQTIIELREI